MKDGAIQYFTLKMLDTFTSIFLAVFWFDAFQKLVHCFSLSEATGFGAALLQFAAACMVALAIATSPATIGWPGDLRQLCRELCRFSGVFVADRSVRGHLPQLAETGSGREISGQRKLCLGALLSEEEAFEEMLIFMRCGQPERASTSRIQLGASSRRARCTNASGGVHRASANLSYAAPAPAVTYAVPAPAVTYAPTVSTLS